MLLKTLHNRMQRQSGQALVEMALVLPILMLLVVGILDFGRILARMQEAEQTASAAARFAAVGKEPPADLASFVTGGEPAEICVTAPSVEVGEPLTVEVRREEKFSSVLIFLGTLDVTGKAQMRIERLPVDDDFYGGC